MEEHQLFFSFLIKTCRNLAFDRNADAQQLPQASLDDLESIAGPDQPVEATLDLDRMLESLEPEERQIMQWVRQGLNVSEIATNLGISYTAAGVRLFRIRKRLSESHG